VDPVNPLFDTATIGTNKSYSDVMLGARYTWAFAERWGTHAARRSDRSARPKAPGARAPSRSTGPATADGLFGYRHLSAEVKTVGQRQRPRITLSGPAIGYGFVLLR
jgi:hypothetical protein